jgi:hypothetical protein
LLSQGAVVGYGAKVGATFLVAAVFWLIARRGQLLVALVLSQLLLIALYCYVVLQNLLTLLLLLAA